MFYLLSLPISISKSALVIQAHIKFWNKKFAIVKLILPLVSQKPGPKSALMQKEICHATIFRQGFNFGYEEVYRTFENVGQEGPWYERG